MARKRHVHKYIKSQASIHNTVWRCAFPQCSHFLPKNCEYLIVGRASYCWGCGEEFALDEDAVKEDMPRCAGCRLGYGGKASFWDIKEAKKEQERAKQKDNIEITEPTGPTAPTGPTPEEERARKIKTIRTYHDPNLGIGWTRTQLEKKFGHELVSAALDTQS